MNLSSAIPDDPFWAAVRRRHPDVDLVELPAPAPAPTTATRPPPDLPDPPEPLDDAAVARRRDEVARLALAVLDALVPGAPPRREHLLPGPHDGAVRSRVTAAFTAEGAVACDRLAGLLLAEPGGTVDVTAEDRGALRLRGALEHIEVLATWSPSTATMVLSIASTPLTVGPAAARRLVRADLAARQAEEVAGS